jgi:hypothetical protein
VKRSPVLGETLPFLEKGLLGGGREGRWLDHRNSLSITIEEAPPRNLPDFLPEEMV